MFFFLEFILIFNLEFIIPNTNKAFDFDSFDYEFPKSHEIKFENNKYLRLEASDCKIRIEVKDSYIYVELNLYEDIPEKSILLFEVFGIPNPTVSKSEFFFFNCFLSKIFLS